MREVSVICILVWMGPGLMTAVPAADLPRSEGTEIYATPTPSPESFWEARLGGTAHDPGSPERGSADINGELLFGKTFSVDRNPLLPRIHLGGSASLGGKTSYGYAGLTWTFGVTDRLFVEGSFGGAVHNGQTGVIVDPGHNKLGCSPLFRESAALGFRLTQNWNVLATIDHMSNAGLCGHDHGNRGLTNFGGKLGYRF